jgi:hypothetical protein
MKKSLEFIFKYLNVALGNTSNTNSAKIYFLGNNEIQLPSDNGGVSNYVFKLEDNPLHCAIIDILDKYYMEEYDNWCHADKPQNHIFHALECLRILEHDLPEQ